MKLSNVFKSFMVLGLVAITGCGGSDESQRVEVDVLPPQPIVFTAPYTYTDLGGTQHTVSPPWARFQLLVNVPSDMGDSVTIIHVNVQSQGIDSTGAFSSTSADFDPTADTYTTTDTLGNSVVCSFTDFGQFDPGGNSAGTGGTYNDTLLFEQPSLSSTACGANPLQPIFYVGSLPAPLTQTPGTIASYSFTLMISPEGWFGKRTTPNSRFLKSVYVTTQ